jgi:hypothetical protein
LVTKQGIDGLGVVVRVTMVHNAMVALDNDRGGTGAIDAAVVNGSVSGNVLGELEAFVHDSRMKADRVEGHFGKRDSDLGSHVRVGVAN